MSASTSARRWWALPAFAAAIAVSFGYWWWQGRPVSLADVPHPKLHCVSYAPFRDAQSPADPALMIAPAQIDADLALLAQRFECVRTYSTAHGQDEVVPIAAHHGLKVILGAWIGRDAARNEAELARTIALANQYPDTVRALVIGNETLLRRELPPEALGVMLRRAKDGTSVPVSYADVWEFWLRNAPLAESVDFVTIHILPYWEDDPIDIARATDHVRNILAKMTAAFAGKTLLIGETGWPSAGRMREGARPGLVNQARFVREFVAFAEERGLEYNLIEAFDQPWKRGQEGTVGGYWGLYDGARAAKFAFSGPVREVGAWRAYWLATCALGGLALALALSRKARFSRWGWAGYALLAFAAAASMVEHARFVAVTSLGARAWLLGALTLALAAASAWIACEGAARGTLRSGPRASLRAVLERAARPWRTTPEGGLWLGALQAAAVLGAAAICLALAVDPRYRDFPTAAFVVPAFAFALMGAPPAADGTEERWLGRILAAAAVAVGVREGPENWQAIGWCATALLLAWPWSGLARAIDWGQRSPNSN